MGTFGAALKALRHDLGLSQSALALRLDSTQRHLSFLETGRSVPSRAMVGRIVSELSLSAAQRAMLLEASGFRGGGGGTARDMSAPDIQAALNLMEQQILTPWPYPAAILDQDWTVQRSNGPAKTMFAQVLGQDGPHPNVFDLLLSKAMAGMIDNWAEASAAIYFRLLEAANRSETAADILGRARRDGLFDHVAGHVVGQDAGQIIVPIRMTIPGVGTVQMTSLLGRMATAHDALVEGLEVELMVPLDPDSAAIMRALFGAIDGTAPT